MVGDKRVVCKSFTAPFGATSPPRRSPAGAHPTVAATTIARPETTRRILHLPASGSVPYLTSVDGAPVPLARDVLGVPGQQIMLEEQARSTWDNIRYSLPLAEQFTAIKIASDPFHVRKAHRHVARIRPDLVTRLEPADCYRPGEYLLLKAAILAYETWSHARRRSLALDSGG